MSVMGMIFMVFCAGIFSGLLTQDMAVRARNFADSVQIASHYNVAVAGALLYLESIDLQITAISSLASESSYLLGQWSFSDGHLGTVQSNVDRLVEIQELFPEVRTVAREFVFEPPRVTPTNQPNRNLFESPTINTIEVMDGGTTQVVASSFEEILDTIENVIDTVVANLQNGVIPDQSDEIESLLLSSGAVSQAASSFVFAAAVQYSEFVAMSQVIISIIFGMAAVFLATGALVLFWPGACHVLGISSCGRLFV